MKDLVFRVDDIGASTKHFNQHGNGWLKIFGKKFFYFPLVNFWFFKIIWPFKGWAKYDELTPSEWKIFLAIFEEFKVIPVVAITATWVDADLNLIPFPEKFPEEAKILKEAFLSNKIIIANHGLTHCVVGKHLPKFWGSNRKYHREFLSELNEEVHREHIIKSQKILEDFFGKPIEIFVPPGNLWSYKTYLALKGTNIKKIMSGSYMIDSDKKMEGIIFVADKGNSEAFHDRELKLYGSDWLKEKIKKTLNK